MYRLDIERGLVQEARQVESPNCDERPPGCEPSLIVVHGISLPPGEFGGPWIDRLFTNTLPADEHPYFAEIAGQEVSAHFLIRRDGSLVQYVPITKRAWHAGQSCFDGRERCNDFSVGIELEGEDNTAYEEAQYHSLTALITMLRRQVPALSGVSVVGHSDIAPGRKTDPGAAFDWDHLNGMLAEREGTRK